MVKSFSRTRRRFSTKSTNYFKFPIDAVSISSILDHTFMRILQQMFFLQFFNSMQSFVAQKSEFFFNFMNRTQTHLPIEAIGNWLNRTNANGQMHNERFLKLKINDDVSNLSEMFEYLKEVYLFFL